ncbi:hypothetical protein NP233_g11234 [Leucocoprinus birnbaumii]|uniref:Uncharacterized protein n=1 Tax=Leucocoprinus birnbaumii TaxID=56174 RepID=A0AAD5VMW2_9AGAR|nr:hypothetical protein NP233_g11234 [Leucocoprinus birnbaumii]
MPLQTGYYTIAIYSDDRPEVGSDLKGAGSTYPVVIYGGHRAWYIQEPDDPASDTYIVALSPYRPDLKVACTKGENNTVVIRAGQPLQKWRLELVGPFDDRYSIQVPDSGPFPLAWRFDASGGSTAITLEPIEFVDWEHTFIIRPL